MPRRKRPSGLRDPHVEKAVGRINNAIKTALMAGWQGGETNEERLVAIGLDAWRRDNDAILRDPDYGVIAQAVVIMAGQQKEAEITGVIRQSVRTLLHGPNVKPSC
ncbi:MAG: hypothetical protein ACTHMJ_03550 [Thermomicrobiales bacterium]